MDTSSGPSTGRSIGYRVETPMDVVRAPVADTRLSKGGALDLCETKSRTPKRPCGPLERVDTWSVGTSRTLNCGSPR